MSLDVATTSTQPRAEVKPSFRVGLPLNSVLFAVGAFWLLLATLAAVHSHLLWTLIFCAVGFAFFAAPLLYYRNASLWADDNWVGTTDLSGRRTAVAREDLAAIEEVSGISRRFRFLRRDGRLAFELHSYGWRPADITAFRLELGL